MKHHRPGRRCQIALGVALLPPVFWVAVLAIIPTDCARESIAERLSKASNREVAIGKIQVGLLGGVYLNDLTIGSPRSEDSPWLKVGEASINVSPIQLLLGKIDPTEVEVSGLYLRVLRRRDGSLELADLLKPSLDSHSSSGETAASEGVETVFRVRDSTVIVVDEPTRTRLEFTEVQGRGTRQGCQANISEMQGSLNSGTVQLAAQFDQSGVVPRFEGQFKVKDVKLGKGMHVLSYLVPVIAGAPDKIDGKLTLDLYLRGQGDSREALRKSVVGHGQVGFDPIQLDGSQLLGDLARVFDVPEKGCVAAVHGDLAVKEGRFATEKLVVDFGKVPLVFTGWTDIDGRVNYRLRSEGYAEKLPGKAKEFLASLTVTPSELADLRVTGTVDALKLTMEGVELDAGDDGESGRRPDRLREIGRRFLDRVRR